MTTLDIDDNREWVQWWIEDEEAILDDEDWCRKWIPGYRDYPVERGVYEDDI